MEQHAPVAAVVTGVGVGVLGGVLGLGGAEFRLPVLVSYFRYRLTRAIPLNLAVSLVTVLAAAFSRILLAREIPEATTLPITIAMMFGGMTGAAVGTRWLTSLSDERSHSTVRTLLIGIGLLLIVEAVTGWEATGLPFGLLGKVMAALLAGILIGIVSSLLGVAGGELIIPTLLLAFGVPIKAAGTLSPLIGIPAILVGLGRHQARGAFRGREDLGLILPMGSGTIAGGIIGGLLVPFAPATVVKLFLACLLIASALKALPRRAQNMTA